MTNRRFLFSALTAAAGLPMLAQTSERPNVILLVADDLGYGDISCYGATRVSTPRIDSIANSGIRFTDCHAAASTSTPSRYSLLTGEYCFRRTDTGIATGDAQMIIRPEQYTIADMFKSVGYQTAAIGKWHLGLGSKAGQQTWNTKLDVGVNDLGFDYSYVMAATADRVPCVFIEDGKIANFDPSAPIQVSYSSNFAGEPTGAANPELLTKLRSSHGHNNSIVNGIGRIGYMKGGGKALWRDEDIADSIMAHAIKYIEEHKDAPFFMYLGTNDVHVPRYPHERFRGKSPMGLRGEAILQFDYSIGLLADALQRLGLAENTLLIITSDNGPVLDDGYQDQAVALAGSHKPAGDFRGAKYSALEAGTTVPFIVSWANGAESGKVSNALTAQIDLIGSMAALVGAEIPVAKAADSQNQLDTWLGRNETPRDYVLCMAQNRTLTLRKNEWKYIEPSNGAAIQNGPRTETGYLSTPQLYNLSTDIHEDNNLYSSNAAKAAEMETLLAKIRRPWLSTADTVFWYRLYTPARGPRYARATGVAAQLTGTLTPSTDESEQWKFVDRGDGTFDIINRKYNSYVVPSTPVRPANPLQTSRTKPATGWQITTNGIMNCLYVFANGTSEFNQSVNGPNYPILNWGDGTNTTDVGCRYAAELFDVEITPPTGISEVKTTAPKQQRLIVVGNKWQIAETGERPAVFNLSGKQVAPKNVVTNEPVVVKTSTGTFITNTTK